MEDKRVEKQNQQIIFEIVDSLFKREGMTEQRAQAILNTAAEIVPVLALATRFYAMGKMNRNQ